ncbi:MAG: hypothetical protein ABSH24_03395 [Bryobacteraceae bacterium]
MIFHDRYELLALRGGDREIALPGREISSGRDVLVHLLSDGYTPENRELLANIDKLPAEYQRRVLDIGDHEGIPYVVTDVLPPNLKLREWLAAAKSAVPSPVASPKTSERPSRSGEWKIPAIIEAPSKSAAEPGAASQDPGEFTRLFPPVKAPAEQPQRAPQSQDDFPKASMVAPKPDRKAPPAPAAQEPGEFTRMLHLAAAQPATATPEAQAPAPVEPEPGEFTRILHAAARPPASMPTAATPPPQPAEIGAAPARQELGEFTRLFQAPAPSAPVAPPPPAPARPQSPAAPGDFTRMMQSPLAAAPAGPPPSVAARAAAPPAQSASEFTRIMQAGRQTEAPPRQVPLPGPAAAPSPPVRSFQAEGEFTRIFATEPASSENLVAPAAPQGPLPQGGVATGAFSRRSAPTQPQAGAGPSEFTQMFAAPTPAPAAKAPAPKPAPPAQKADKSYLPLVLILAGLFVLVVIVILVFALTR